jgi:hypothetical protein
VIVMVAATVSNPKDNRRPREDATIARNMKFPGPQDFTPLNHTAMPDG